MPLHLVSLHLVEVASTVGVEAEVEETLASVTAVDLRMTVTPSDLETDHRLRDGAAYLAQIEMTGGPSVGKMIAGLIVMTASVSLIASEEMLHRAASTRALPRLINRHH